MTKRRLLIGLAVALAAGLLAIGLLLGTSWGLGTAFRLAEAFAGVEIESEGLEGSLLGGVRADSLEVGLEGTRARIEGLQSSWELKLSEGSFHLRSLQADFVRVELPPGEDEPEEPLESLPVVDLGIAVSVDRLEVARLELVMDGGEARVATGIATSFELAEGVLDVSSLAASYEPVALTGSLNVDTGSGYRHRIDIAVDLEGKPVQLSLEGDLAESRIEVSAEAWATEVEGRLLTVLETPGFDLRVRSGFEPIDADLHLRGELPRLELQGTVASGEQEAVIRTLTAEIGQEAVELAGRIGLETAGVELVVQRARVGLAGKGPVDALVSWSWLGPESGPLGESAGRLQVEGPFDDLSVVADGTLPLNGRPFEILLEAFVGAEQAEVRQLSLEGQGMRVGFGGEVAWNEGFAIEAEGVVEKLNPELFLPDWPASIDGTVSVSGTEEELEIVLSGLQGHFLQRPLQADGRLVLQQLAPAQAALDLRSGRSRIVVEAPDWNEEPIRVALDLESLGDLVPELEGSLQGTATVVPHESGLEVEAEIEGASLRWQEWSLASVAASASLDTRPGGRVSAQLEAGAVDGPLSLTRVQLEATGHDRSVDFSTAIESDFARLESTGSLELSEARSVRLDLFELSTRDFGDWKLSDPTTVYLEETPRMEPSACLASSETRLCVDLPATQEEAGRFLLEGFPLGLLENVASAGLGQSLTMQGELNADFRWNLRDGRPVVHGQLLSEGVELTLGEGEEDPQSLSLTGLHLEAHGEEDLELDLQLSAPGGSATLIGSIAAWTLPEQAEIDLLVEVDLPDLADFALLVPMLEELAGGVKASIRARGALTEPSLTGQAVVSDLAFTATALGTQIRQGNLEIDFDESGAVEVDGRIELAEGILEVAGSAQVQPPRAEITMTAADALLVDLPIARIQADAAIELTVDDAGIDLQGEVGILESRVVLGPSTPTVSPSPDVVFVDAPLEEEASSDRPLRASVRVRTLAPVSITGFGLDAEIQGEVKVLERPGQVTSASGNLQLGGTYSIYGQTLEISRGRVVFANSSVTDPLLDVEATRETESALVGVRVGGAVTQPTVTFFSYPPLSESEILSLLILGYSLSDPTQQEAGAISAALMGLRMTTAGMGGDEPGFLEKLGFTEVGLDVRSDLGGAAFSIGRYLTPKLYVGYAIGLRESIDVLSLRFELTDRWAVGAEAGQETRARISYRVETGEAKIPKDPNEDREP